jgi:hypothetical protein
VDAFWSGFIAAQHGVAGAADSTARAGLIALLLPCRRRMILFAPLLFQCRFPEFARLILAYTTSSPCLPVSGLVSRGMIFTAQPTLTQRAGISEFLLPHFEPQQALAWLQSCR